MVSPRKKRTPKKKSSRSTRKEYPRKKRKKTPSRALFKWPLKGIITSKFGYRKKGQRHDGIDIAAKKGTPIYAAKSGKVIYSDNRLRHYGNTVILKHAGSWFTVYAHNKKNIAKVGDWVTQGKKIAEVGKTGRVTGPHLHFEIRKKEIAVNPFLYLPR